MYTPLYIKTDNSLQSSLISVKHLIDYAKEKNIKSLAITDNNMYGCMDFYKSCIHNNIKPITGLEIEIENYIIVLYGTSYNGYKNLIHLATIKSERNLSLSDLEKYSNDIICIVPFDSMNLYNNLNKIYINIFKSYKNKLEFNELSGDNLIFMNETIFLKKEDQKYFKYLKAIKESKTIEEIDITSDKNYLLSMDEVSTLYSETIENNEKITELCNLEIPFHQNLMPKFENEEGLDSYTYLKKKCIEGLKNIFGSTVKEAYKKRLKYELDVINKMGFCDYFLIVSDYVKWAKNNNIIVGTGRGSAVGSLVSYCLNITDVDPLRYDLIFERFLNPERISMPDIDIDFEHDKREEVIKYCIQKYGEKRVVPIITFGTLGAKQAIRDVARSMDLNLSLVDSICKLIDSNLSLKENYDSKEKIRMILKRNNDLLEMYKVALKFEGLKRHTSIHAAGVVMSSVDLDSVIPLDKSHDFYVSGYDMTYLEEIGLLKMDFLAIKYLTTIHNIIDSINKDYNLNIKFDEIPLEDPKAINIFNKADTVGIFQFESEGMINFLRKLKATNMDDIFAAIALYRPGPMKNIPSYINRKHLKEKIDYIDPTLEKILKSTYGIIIYQEQIMQISTVMADYTLGEADILRKAMSKKKKDILLKEEEKFTKRAIEKGYSKSLVTKVYEAMLKFAEYGFNKSHSVGYSIVAYKMAYLKAHFPKNFITYLLSMEINDEAKTKQYIYEAKKNNIDILKPDINFSDKKYVIEDIGIRYPLSSIKNVGVVSSDVIIKERENGIFIDIYDFIKRCYSKSVTRKTIESLILASAFSNFGYNKRTLIENLDLIINYGELIKDLDRTYTLEPEIVLKEEYDKKYLIEKELEVFGFYFTHNPITDYKNKYNNIINLNEIAAYFDKLVNIIVYVDKVKEVSTKKNDKMCFINGSDELSKIDIILFPNMYDKHNDISKGYFILVSGKVEKRFDKYQIIASKITKLS